MVYANPLLFVSWLVFVGISSVVARFVGLLFTLPQLITASGPMLTFLPTTSPMTVAFVQSRDSNVAFAAGIYILPLFMYATFFEFCQNAISSAVYVASRLLLSSTVCPFASTFVASSPTPTPYTGSELSS